MNAVAHHQITRPAAVLRATGPDAFAFLQSQFSNDLRRPAPAPGGPPATYGLWLDRKGKIQADSFVVQLAPEKFLAVSHHCPAAGILAHLQAHLIADEVELQDETGAFALLQTCYLRRQAGALPQGNGEGEIVRELDVLDSAKLDRSGVLSWPSRVPGNAPDRLGEISALEELAALLPAGEPLLPAGDLMHLHRIRGAVPGVPFDAPPGTLPQEVGLERDAVSFDKGCYLGQEVMARIQAQGHVNRSLRKVELPAELSAKHFTAEPLPLYAGSEAAGELRSRMGASGLALLKNRLAAGRTALSLSPGGPENVRLVPANPPA